MGSIPADSGGEVDVTEQSQLRHFNNFPFAQLPPFTFAATSLNGERIHSNLSVSESQIDAQKKFLEHQIEVWEYHFFPGFLPHRFFGKKFLCCFGSLFH